jgi:hypothetical protein
MFMYVDMPAHQGERIARHSGSRQPANTLDSSLETGLEASPKGHRNTSVNRRGDDRFPLNIT